MKLNLLSASVAAALAAAALNAAEPGYATLISHRGESHDAPENTLPAYKTAVERGFGFECDVYLSKDGRVFTFHDSTLKRTTAGANTKACGEVSWDEIEKLDVGAWGKWKGSKFAGTRPALLEEVLELARDGREIYVEVKTGPEIVPYIKKVFAAQRNATPKNVLFISFNEKSCRALKDEMPEYRVYWLSGAMRRSGGKSRPVTAEEVVKTLKETGADGLDIQFVRDVVTADFIRKVNAAGFSVHVWTVDSLTAAVEAFRRSAATVTTNRAKKLLDRYLNPPPDAAKRFWTQDNGNGRRGPLVQAHRGSRGEYQDNAAGGFAWCLGKGIRGFEVDVRFTRDHRLVVMHDNRMGRTTDATGVVERLSFAEFRAARLRACPESPPTIEEVLAPLAGRDDVFIELEMKAYPGEFYTDAVLREYCAKLNAAAKAAMKPGTYAITCFNRRTLEIMREVDASAPLGLIIGGGISDDDIDFAVGLECVSVAPMLVSTTAEQVRKAQKLGMSVCLWMVQNAADYAKAKAIGANRVTSDYPHLLAEMLAGRRKKVVAMDLDGTLSQHKTPVPWRNLKALEALRGAGYELVMVGGGGARRIYNQMCEFPIEILGNYGMEHSVVTGGQFRIVRAVTNQVDRARFLAETGRLREKYGYTKYAGDPLQFHASGMVTFGLLGTSPSAEEKLAFDPDKRRRRAMFADVAAAFPDCAVFIGGTTSFDLAAKEYNKYDATVKWARERGYGPEDVVFIGDDFNDGGNDSHARIGGLDRIVITDYRNFADAVGVLLKRWE